MRLLKLNIIATALLAMFFVVSCNKNNKNNNAMGNETTNSTMAANDNNNGMFSDNNDNGAFDFWDGNSDGVVTQSEFQDRLRDTGFFDGWDTNNNGVISEGEWSKGIDSYFSSYDASDYGDFNAWDENGDGVIKEDEFDNGLFDFVDHDSNDKISDNEFNNWFDWWPGNENNY